MCFPRLLGLFGEGTEQTCSVVHWILSGFRSYRAPEIGNNGSGDVAQVPANRYEKRCVRTNRPGVAYLSHALPMN